MPWTGLLAPNRIAARSSVALSWNLLLAPTRGRWPLGGAQFWTEMLAPNRIATRSSVALSFPKLTLLAKENWRARQDSNL